MMRSPLGRARGLGSAKSGVVHFWHQRLTAIALVPLALWFVISVVGLAGADYKMVHLWLAKPLNATLMILCVVTALWHAMLGVQVVIEDYIHTEAFKYFGLIGVRLLTGFLAMFTAVSVLKVAVGG